jgi:hypothetical protein
LAGRCPPLICGRVHGCDIIHLHTWGSANIGTT